MSKEATFIPWIKKAACESCRRKSVAGFTWMVFASSLPKVNQSRFLPLWQKRKSGKFLHFSLMMMTMPCPTGKAVSCVLKGFCTGPPQKPHHTYAEPLAFFLEATGRSVARSSSRVAILSRRKSDAGWTSTATAACSAQKVGPKMAE